MNRFKTKPFRAVYVNSLDAFIPELWAQESVAILVENMVISNLVHKDFSEEVAKFGDIVHTRKPAEFIAQRKTNADSVTVQDASATDIQVPLDQHFHTSFMLKDGEETKSFLQLRDEYLAPAVLSLAQALDKVLLGESHMFWRNAEGIRGGLTTTNLIQYLVETRKRMNINKAYTGGRNLILTSTTEATALQISTFHEADKVGDEGTAMREASLGRKFQFDMYMCQNAPSTIGIPVNANEPLIDLVAGYAIGTTTIHVDTAGTSLEVGQWISSGGVLHHVTALANTAGEDLDVTISPGLRVAVDNDDVVVIGSQGLVDDTDNYALGYSKELTVDTITGIIPVGSLLTFATPGSPNVIKGEKYSVIETTETGTNTTGLTLNKPLDVAIDDDDVIHFAPPAEHNFAFHRNAIALVSRPLAPAPEGLALSSVASANGIGIRVTITYNGSQQGVLITVDLLCGLEVLDLNLGALLIG